MNLNNISSDTTGVVSVNNIPTLGTATSQASSTVPEIVNSSLPSLSLDDGEENTGDDFA